MRISDWSSDVCSSDQVSVSEAEIAEALSEPGGQIVGAVRVALERTAPELAADMIDEGITHTGGGELLGRMDEAIPRATGLPVRSADDAPICVVRGAGTAFEDGAYHGILIAAGGKEERRGRKGGVSTFRMRWSQA